MTNLTLPPLSQATKLPETKKRLLLAEIALYWSKLALPDASLSKANKQHSSSEEAFDNAWSHPSVKKQMWLLSQALKWIKSS